MVNNFGHWIKHKLNELNITDKQFIQETGIGNSGVNRWSKDQQPRIDLFIVSCEVIARLSGQPLLITIIEALTSVPSYRSAVKRLDNVSQGLTPERVQELQRIIVLIYEEQVFSHLPRTDYPHINKLKISLHNG